MNQASADDGVDQKRRLPELDGWRALSIILVLAGHLLPLGPASWLLNGAAVTTGMAIFFVLSGFLVTRIVAQGAPLKSFMLRRIVRVAPLAWLIMAAALPFVHASTAQYLANFLFYANLPPFYLLPSMAHLWSVCLEVQFYLFIALIIALCGRRSLYFLPCLCLIVTVIKIAAAAPISIVTWFRADEVLAGATLALMYEGWFGSRPIAIFRHIGSGIYLLIPLLVISGYYSNPLTYIRPYIAAAMVGASLYGTPRWLEVALRSRVAAYVAAISYALYIFHGVAGSTWLGTGEKTVKYLKRPLLLLAVFATSHVSTFYFERPLRQWGRRISTG